MNAPLSKALPAAGPAALANGPLAAYGLLRMPLALLELPLFVFLPALYGGQLGVDLAIVGAVLFAARLLDALADPLIGRAVDRSAAHADHLRWIQAGLPLLAIGFAAMLLPPVRSAWLPAWLAATSVLTYLAYSAISIAYQAWGARIGTTPPARARVTAVREGFGLFGVLLAAGLLAAGDARVLVASFIGLTVLAALLLHKAQRPVQVPDAAQQPGLAPPWRDVLRNRHFRWLLLAFVLNGIATAMPATLVLFFVQDVLGADERASALFLGAYFLAGAAGMPLWVYLARRAGLRNAWLLGMAFAVLAFVWALGLGRGDTAAFFAVCLLTGLALGSDLAIPPALLAGVIADARHGGREGSYFGIWNLATKANLAVAAGIALPLLSLLGYTPGQGSAPLALSMAYAALPCALKLAAGLVVLLAPLPEEPQPCEEHIR